MNVRAKVALAGANGGEFPRIARRRIVMEFRGLSSKTLELVVVVAAAALIRLLGSAVFFPRRGATPLVESAIARSHLDGASTPNVSPAPSGRPMCAPAESLKIRPQHLMLITTQRRPRFVCR